MGANRTTQPRRLKTVTIYGRRAKKRKKNGRGWTAAEQQQQMDRVGRQNRADE